jgi:virulence-associated protein VagC
MKKAKILYPAKKSWTPLIKSLKMFTDDFMKEGRRQPPVRK